jgi:hypothetical protein
MHIGRSKFMMTAALALLLPTLAAAKILKVPSQYPTIYEAISSANNGDTVLVSPGTYNESISFLGKAITVTSSDGPKATIIDGTGYSVVVAFTTAETFSSILSGFTIQNAEGGSGVEVSNASPTIKGNYILNNNTSSCPSGPGISISFGSPLIQGNIIMNNGYLTCQDGGGGISDDGAGSAEIVGNTIANNSGSSAISLFAAGTPAIADNLIYDNDNSYGQGGAIGMVNDSGAIVVQNLMYGNIAMQGTEVLFLVPEGAQPPVFVNNTIIGGSGSTQGTAVYAGGFDDGVAFYNNLLIGQAGQNAVYCDNSYDPNPPLFMNNDAWGARGGSGLQGTCASQSDENGNISANPQFVGPTKNNFQLKTESPAVNAGDNSAPDILKKDLAHRTRIVGGTIDLGAYENQTAK